jgi:hypothetical protein
MKEATTSNGFSQNNISTSSPDGPKHQPSSPDLMGAGETFYNASEFDEGFIEKTLKIDIP